MPTPPFTIAWLVQQPQDVQQQILSRLTLHEQAALRYCWTAWARPKQQEPQVDWSTWLILAGGGSGKTRAGAEWVLAKKETCSRIALVGETAADARDVMVEGESGILAISPPWNKPTYNPSKRDTTQLGSMS